MAADPWYDDYTDEEYDAPDTGEQEAPPEEEPYYQPPPPEEEPYYQPPPERPAAGYDPGTGYELDPSWFSGDWGAPSQTSREPTPQAYWPKQPIDQGTGYELPTDWFSSDWGTDDPYDQRIARATPPSSPYASTPGLVHPTEAGPPDTWPDGRGMSEEEKRLAQVYQGSLDNGLDAEGARAMVSVAKTEGGLFGAPGDHGTSFGPFQLHEGGQFDNFKVWLTQQGIVGDPRQLANDVDLATRFASSTYLGNTIKQGQQRGVHGAALATYGQEHGQVSINPWKAGQNYSALFPNDVDPYADVMAHAVPTSARRAARSAAQGAPGEPLTMGATQANPDLATPYTEQQADKSGRVWTIAFDYDQPYDHPFNAQIPRHRGIDLIIPDAERQGYGQNGEGAPYTAFQNGTVVAVTDPRSDPNGGVGIIVQDPQTGLYSRYFHNNQVFVKPGDQVAAGQTVLGTVGHTGTEGFPHLHFEVSHGLNGDPMGQTVDPRGYISQPVRTQRQASAQAPAPTPAPAPAQAPAGAPARTSADPNGWLDTHSRGLLDDWQKMRAARGENYLDTNEFRAHLGRIGAPDPWQQAAEQVRTAMAPPPQQTPSAGPPPAAPVPMQAAPAAPAVPVYTVGGRRVSKDEYDAAAAQNAEIDRGNAAYNRVVGAQNERAAAAREELARLERWQTLAQAAQVDPEAASTLGPRPDTPNLDYLHSQDIALSESAAPREQAAAPKQDLATWVERQQTDEGAHEATRAQNAQLAQNVYIQQRDQHAREVAAFQQRYEEQSAALRAQYGVETPLEVVTDAQGRQTVRPTPQLSTRMDQQQALAAPTWAPGMPIPADWEQEAATRQFRPPPIAPEAQTAQSVAASQDAANALAIADRARARGLDPSELYDPAQFPVDPATLPYPARYHGRYQVEEQRGNLVPEGPAAYTYAPALVNAIYQGTPRSLGEGFSILTDQVAQAATGTVQSLGVNIPTYLSGELAEMVPQPNTRPPMLNEPPRQQIGPAAWTQAASNALDTYGQRNQAWVNEVQSSMQGRGVNIAPVVGAETNWADPTYYSGLVAQSVPSIATAAGLAAIGGMTGSPLAAAALPFAYMYASEASDAYTQAIQSGVPRAQALRIARVVGVANGTLENLPMVKPVLGAVERVGGAAARTRIVGALTRGLGQSLAEGELGQGAIGQAVRRAGKSGVLQWLEEGTQEGSEEVFQGLIQNMGQATYTQNADLTQGLAQAFMGGFIPGMALGSTQGIGHRALAGHGAQAALSEGPPTPGQILYAEGVRIIPTDDNWTSYWVGSPGQSQVMTVDPRTGLVGVSAAPETMAMTLPRVDTDEQRYRAVSGVNAITQQLVRQGQLSDQVARQATATFAATAQDATALVTDGARKSIRASEAPQTYAEAGGQLIAERTGGPYQVDLAQRWTPPTPLGDSGMVIRSHGQADPRSVQELAQHPLLAQVTRTAADEMDRVDDDLRGEGLLPAGRRRPIGAINYGGTVLNLNHGRTARAEDSGHALDANAVSFDFAQGLVSAIVRAEARGIDWRTDPRFTQDLAIQNANSIGHEGIGHDYSRDHDAEFSRALDIFAARRDGIVGRLAPIYAEAQQNGQLESLYEAQLRNLQVSPSPAWRDYARARLAVLESAGRSLDYPASAAQQLLRAPGREPGQLGAAVRPGAPAAGPGSAAVLPGRGGAPGGLAAAAARPAAGVAPGRPAALVVPGHIARTLHAERAARSTLAAQQGYGPSAQVAEDIARLQPGPIRMPTDNPLFMQAVAATPAARFTDDGMLTVDAVRFQHPDQLGEEAARGMIHYLPVGSPNERAYRNAQGSGGMYGGTVRTQAPTTMRRPLVVRGATGGGAMEQAYDTLTGQRGAYTQLLDQVGAYLAPGFEVARGQELIYQIDQALHELGGDPSATDAIYQASTDRRGAPVGNRAWTAIAENVLGQRLRTAGYDSIVGITRRRDGSQAISEIASATEASYPDETGWSYLREGYEPEDRAVGPSAESGAAPYNVPPAYVEQVRQRDAYGWPSQQSLEAARSIAEQAPTTWKDPYLSADEIANAIVEARPSTNRDRVLAGVERYWPTFEPYLEAFGLADDLPTRLALLGTIAVETDWRFEPINEYSTGQQYEGRRDLGNTQPGDGPRFKGRGFIQITGRANYDHYGRRLGVDLVNNPTQALDPATSAAISVGYLVDHGIPELAREGDWVGVRHAINGGDGGLTEFQSAVSYLSAASSGRDQPRISQGAHPLNQSGYRVANGGLVFQGYTVNDGRLIFQGPSAEAGETPELRTRWSGVPQAGRDVDLDRVLNLDRQGLTLQAISDETGVPLVTVSRWLGASGRARRVLPTHAEASSARSEMVALARDNATLSAREIADRIGMPYETVRGWLGQEGLARPVGMSAHLASLRPRTLQPQHVGWINEYLNGGSPLDIAASAGVSKTAVRMLLRRWDVPPRPTGRIGLGQRYHFYAPSQTWLIRSGTEVTGDRHFELDPETRRWEDVSDDPTDRQIAAQQRGAFPSAESGAVPGEVDEALDEAPDEAVDEAAAGAWQPPPAIGDEEIWAYRRAAALSAKGREMPPGVTVVTREVPARRQKGVAPSTVPLQFFVTSTGHEIVLPPFGRGGLGQGVNAAYKDTLSASGGYRGRPSGRWQDRQGIWHRYDSPQELLFMQDLDRQVQDKQIAQWWRTSVSPYPEIASLPYIKTTMRPGEEPGLAGFEGDFVVQHLDGVIELVEAKDAKVMLQQEEWYQSPGKRPALAWNVLRKTAAAIPELAARGMRFSLATSRESARLVPKHGPSPLLGKGGTVKSFWGVPGVDWRDLPELDRAFPSGGPPDSPVNQIVDVVNATASDAYDLGQRLRAEGLSADAMRAQLTRFVRARLLPTADIAGRTTGEMRNVSGGIVAPAHDWQGPTGAVTQAQIEQAWPAAADAIRSAEEQGGIIHSVVIDQVQSDADVTPVPRMFIQAGGDPAALQRLAAQLGATAPVAGQAYVWHYDWQGPTVVRPLTFVGANDAVQRDFALIQAAMSQAGPGGPQLIPTYNRDGSIATIHVLGQDAAGAVIPDNALRSRLNRLRTALAQFGIQAEIGDPSRAVVSNFAAEGGYADAIERREQQLGLRPLPSTSPRAHGATDRGGSGPGGARSGGGGGETTAAPSDRLGGGVRPQRVPPNPGTREGGGAGSDPELTVEPNQPDGPQPGDLQGGAFPSAEQGETPDAVQFHEGRASMTDVNQSIDEIIANNIREVNQRYSGDMGEIVVKEMVQNTVDASRQIPGAHTQVSMYPAERRIMTIDQGTGMPREVVSGAFIKFGQSYGKTTASSGGMGTAKISILGRAQKVEMRTVARRDDGSYEETIAWGDANDYLDPRLGLRWKAGALGWIDEAIANGTLPPDSLTQSALLAPWDQSESPNGTGTRLSVALNELAQWNRPQDRTWGKTKQEDWIDDFNSTNHLEAQTVGYDYDGVPYTSAPELPQNKASTFLTTIDGPTWAIDLYVSEALSETKHRTVKVQNNGLYQIGQFIELPSEVPLPTEIIANVRTKVGAQDYGYPWSPDRKRLVAEADRELEDYVKVTMYGDIAARSRAAMELAIQNGIKLPRGDGYLLNTGALTGDDLRQLEDLAKQPYMAHLNPALRELHDNMEQELRGKTFGVKGGMPFMSSTYGGFGLANDWVGLNVGLAGLKTRYTTERLILFDPWALIREAVLMSRTLDQPILQAAGAAPSSRAGARRAPLKPVTETAARFDPTRPIKVKLPGYIDGKMMTPEELATEVSWNRAYLEDSQASGRDADADYYTRALRDYEPPFTAWTKKLSDMLVARAVLHGEPQTTVDPDTMSLTAGELDSETRWVSPDRYATMDQLADNVAESEDRIAELERTGQDVPQWRRENLAKQTRYLAFNRDIEERILRHQLARGEIPTVYVQTMPFTLDQGGIDMLAAAEVNAATENRDYYSSQDSDYSQRTGRVGIARTQDALDRYEAITGLKGRAEGNVGGEHGAYADVAASSLPFNPLFLIQLRGQLLGTGAHEQSHNAALAHNETFSGVLTRMPAAFDNTQATARLDRVLQRMAADGSLRAMFGDMPLYFSLRNAENVLQKISVGNAPSEALYGRPVPAARRSLGEYDVAGERLAQATGLAVRGDVPADDGGQGVPSGSGVRAAASAVPVPADRVRGLPGDGRRPGEAGLRGPSAELGDTPAHDYASTQLDMPPAVAARVQALQQRIDPSDLTDKGLEDQPHVTVKYGLEADGPEAVRDIVARHGPITVTLGRTSIFPADTQAGGRPGQFDVVKLDVDSPELRALNAELSELPNGDSHPTYEPHLTLAYVKPGSGQQYVGMDDLDGQQVTLDTLTFSGKDEVQTPLPLGEQGPSAQTGETPGPPPIVDPFYSQLERTMVSRMPKQAVAGRIRNLTKGVVKASELAWTGFDDWLDSHGQRPISRDEVMAFIAAHQVKLEETVYGASQAVGPEDVNLDQYEVSEPDVAGDTSITYTASAPGVEEDGVYEALGSPEVGWSVRDGNGTDLSYQAYYALDDAEDAMREDFVARHENTEDRPRWEGQQLVGPYENYRELLLSIPPQLPSTEGWTAVPAPGYGRYSVSDADGNEIVQLAGHDPDDAIRRAALSQAPIFTQGHFEDVNNLVVHLRFSDRQTADGRPLFFIEEIQSDWHQQGREHGYRQAGEGGLAAQVDQLLKERDRLQAEANDIRDNHPDVIAANEASSAAHRERQRLDQAHQAARQSFTPDLAEVQRLYDAFQAADRRAFQAGNVVYNVRRDLMAGHQQQISDLNRQIENVDRDRLRQPPPGPWSEMAEYTGLAFRRAVRWAAEQGHTLVGWTTGAQQNAINSLSQVADQVTYTADADGSPQGWLTGHRADRQVFEERVPRDKLPDWIGKELTAQLLASAPSDDYGRDSYTISTQPTEIGGKGMRRAYDEVLPDIARKLGKPFGAQVGQVEIAGEYGAPVYDLVRPDGTVAISYDSEQTAREVMERGNRGGQNLTLATRTGDRSTVHSLEITPAMQHSVLHVGQPLFEMGDVPSMPYTEPGDALRAAQRSQPSAEEGSQMSLWDNRGDPIAVPIGDPEGLPEDDPYIRLDPVDLEQLDLDTATQEIELPHDPPRTDSVQQAVEQVIAPDAPPPSDPGEYRRASFPFWAHRMLDLGELASARTDVTTREPQIGGAPGVTTTRSGIEGVTDTQVLDIHQAILHGPNRDLFSDADIDALRSAIALQWNRLVNAAAAAPARGSSEEVAMAATRTLEESRRYSALYGLALVPKANWDLLAGVWQSAPISGGEAVTLDEFLSTRKAWLDTSEEEAAREAALTRAEKLLTASPRFRAPKGRTRNARIVEAAQAINRAVSGSSVQDASDPNAPRGTVPVSPSGIARAMTKGDYLKISPIEVLQGMTYNNMLSGPRGIAVDYVSDTIQLMIKTLTDPLLPSQGGWNPRTRAYITAAEVLAMRQFAGLAMHRISTTLLDGIDDLQASGAGIPHSISGKLAQSQAEAHAEADRLEAAAERAEIDGRDRDAVRLRREARGQRGRAGGYATQQVLAIGFTDWASRLKGVADIGIRTIAWGMEQTRQAAVIATNEPGAEKVGSKAWYARIGEIMDGDNIAPEVYAEMTERSNREAQRVVFQGQMGTIGRQMERIQHNPAGSVILPFLRALYHIRGWAIDLSPVGLAVTAGDVLRAQVPLNNGLMRTTKNLGGLAGGPYRNGYRGTAVGPSVADLDRRLVFNAVGTAAFVGLLAYAFAGAVSGSGPPDQPIDVIETEGKPDYEKIDLRNALYAQGWRPYSVRVPMPWGQAYWLSYGNWGPFAYLLSSVAAIAESHKYGLAEPTKDAGLLRGLWELGTQSDAGTVRTMGRRFFGVVNDASYMKNLFDFYGLMRNTALLATGGGGPSGEGAGSRLARERRMYAENNEYAGSLMTRFIPVSGLLQTIAQSQDPYERATEYGSIRQSIAERLPDTGYPLPPSISPPNLIGAFTQDPFGSTTGTRSGLPVRMDALGRPQENLYGGIYAWLPFRASREDYSNESLNALIDAGVGVPSPPTWLIYSPPPTPGKPPSSVLVAASPAMRQEMTQLMGQLIDERIQKVLDEVPESERRADPQAWHDRLAGIVGNIYGGTYKEVADAYRKREDVKNELLPALAQDSSRVRPFDTAIPNPADADKPGEPATPGATPRAGGTPPSIGPPKSTPTPGPTAVPHVPRVPGLGGAPVAPAPATTPRPAATPGATPRAGATATPRPAATPTPTAPPNSDRDVIRRLR